MKIVKNTSGYDTKAVRAIIILAHSHLRSFEKRSAPNWDRLRVLVRGRDKGSHTSGCAYLGGYGNARYDMCLTLPRRGLFARELLWLAYHELCHVYGYRHRQFTDIHANEQARLIPVDCAVAAATPKAKPAIDPKAARIASLLDRRVKWESRLKRAQRALQKINRSVRYYERQQPQLIAAARTKR